ncbi:MAG: LptF/LptG family permease [Chitinispirillia bacterium]|nr:LptF/LptG family permease [Chitinispirillia bacterium]
MLLYRYVIKEHIFPFLASLCVIVFLFVMQQAILLLDRIVSKNVDPFVVLEVFLIQLGWILALAIPMAILCATLMTFGRMAADNEITAIKASGRSMHTLMIPVVSASFVLMVSLAFFHDLILPEANHHAANLLGDISRKRPAAFIEPGVLIRDFPNYTMQVEEVNARSGALKGIRILSNDPNQDPSVTAAASGSISMSADEQYLQLFLYDGETHSRSRANKKEYLVARFAKQVFYIKNIDTGLERTKSAYRSDREKTNAMMLQDVKELRASTDEIFLQFTSSLDSIREFILRADSLSLSDTALSVSSYETAAFDDWSKRFRRNSHRIVNQVKIEQNTTERVIRRKETNDTQIAQYMVEVHKKFAIPAACVIFILIGAPLGIMAKRGGLAVGASYSVFFFIIYWAFLITGENLGDKMIVSPFVGMWSGNIFLILCGVILTILMLRETTFNFGFIKNIFGKNNRVFGVLTRSWLWKLPGVLFKLPYIFLRVLIKRLPTYLIGIFTGYTIGLLLAIIVIFVTVDYVGNLKKFEQANYTQIALFYYYYLPWITQTVLPIVLLLSSMFTLGRLSKSSEITAMKAAGINIKQLTSPLLLLGLLISLGSFYGGEQIIPKANEQRRELQASFGKKPQPAQTEAPQGSAIREYRKNFFYFADPQTMYLYDEFCTNPQYARGVKRYTFKKDGLVEFIEAPEAVYSDSGGWQFVNGQVRTFSDSAIYVENFTLLADTKLSDPPPQLVKRVRSKEEMSYWELSTYIEAAKKRGEPVNKFMAELEFKLALPFMNFIVILLGAAITARTSRRGGGPALFGIGLLMTFAYWILSRFTLVFAQNGHLPIVVGAWSCNVIFLFIGLVLYRKAAH